MNPFITDHAEFAAAMNALGTVLRAEETFPAQVLKGRPAAFALISADLPFTGGSDEFVPELFPLSEGLAIYFASLSPDPEAYFFRHFGQYPLVRYDEAVDGAGFRAPLNEDPGDSPADALITGSVRYAIFPRDASWVVYGDRDVELGVVAAFGAAVAPRVLQAFPADTLFDAEGALRDLLEPAFRGGVPPEFQAEFLRNYGMARE